ncbi:MAG: AraC family transcriptional regulator [Verrucomicrobia bacterium]|nr:AraC family transcriptional regulator [Verrucomicrobiota bacterium]
MALQNIPKRLRFARSAQVLFGDVVYEPGGTCGPRVQQDYQLVVLVEGDAKVDVAGREVAILAGQVGLFRPGLREFFRLSEKRKTHHTWCSVAPALVGGDLARACIAAPEVLPVTRRFEQLMELGLSLPLAAGERAPGLVESLGLAALQEYLFAGQRAPHSAPEEPDALRRALEWIGQEGHQAVNLPALAREAGVSPAQLVKLFRRHLGTTPIRHVWETRTRRGAQLLRETGLTVGEIAFRCGFQTPFHFSRWVRELFGVSPRALRSKEWGTVTPKA